MKRYEAALAHQHDVVDGLLEKEFTRSTLTISGNCQAWYSAGSSTSEANVDSGKTTLLTTIHVDHAGNMSVDIDWKTLTEGPDGAALAEGIRAFVHERFQHVSLPRLIRSVKCQAFDFGTVTPQIVLKDICDPLPDFYEDDEEGEDDAQDEEAVPQPVKVTESVLGPSRSVQDGGHSRGPSRLDFLGRSASPALSRAATPGILGGTSNLGYFHLPLSAGISGTNTPLAAVAGAHFQHGAQGLPHQHHHSESFSSISPPPSATPPSRPTSRDNSSYFDQRRASAVTDRTDTKTQSDGDMQHDNCLLYTSPSPRDGLLSRMPSSA